MEPSLEATGLKVRRLFPYRIDDRLLRAAKRGASVCESENVRSPKWGRRMPPCSNRFCDNLTPPQTQGAYDGLWLKSPVLPVSVEFLHRSSDPRRTRRLPCLANATSRFLLPRMQFREWWYCAISPVPPASAFRLFRWRCAGIGRYRWRRSRGSRRWRARWGIAPIPWCIC